GEAPPPAAERRAFDEATTPIVARPAPHPEAVQAQRSTDDVRTQVEPPAARRAPPAHLSSDEVATQVEPPALRQATPAHLSTDEDAIDIMPVGRAPQVAGAVLDAVSTPPAY